MRQTVVVTGGTGKVGVHIVQRLLKSGYHVHVLVRTPPAPEHPLHSEHVTLTVMDLIALPEQGVRDWLNRVRPRAFIHAAALADVLLCEREPSQAYLVNTHSTKMLARACSYHKIHFILLSTAYVFDGTLPPTALYHECDPVHPLNHYGESKVRGERATREECSGETVWTICRASVVYGATQGRPDFVQWVHAMLAHNENIQVAVDQINSPIHVLDLAQMLVSVLEQRLQGIYHIAGRTSVSRYEFALKIAQSHGLNAELIQPMLTSELPASCWRPLNASLCTDKITADAEVHPISLEEGLDFTRFLRERE